METTVILTMNLNLELCEISLCTSIIHKYEFLYAIG